MEKVVVITHPNYQHRITKAYLRNFVSPSSTDNRLWVYKKGIARPERKGPKKVSAESHLFDLTGIPGHERDLDDYFTMIETHAIPAVKKLISGLQISCDEINAIVCLVASFMVRGVRFDEHVVQDCLHWCRSNPSGGKSFLGDFVRHDGPGNLVIPATGIQKDNIPPRILNGQRWFIFQHYIKALYKLRWYALSSHDVAEDFVTSNNPVDQTNDENPPPPGSVMGSNAPAIANPLEMIKPGSRVTCPLGLRCALIGKVPRTDEPESSATQLSNDDVFDINMRTVRSASQIYSSTRDYNPPKGWCYAG